MWYNCLDKGLVEDAGQDLSNFSTAFFQHRSLRSSGPEALLGLKRFRSFLVPLGSIDIFCISGYGLGPFKGLLPAFSRVYIDPNCLLNMSAFDRSLLKFFIKDQKPFRSISVTAFYISRLVSGSDRVKVRPQH